MTDDRPLGIPATLWAVLACPCPEHAPVTADETSGHVLCTRCRTSFEVRDGVPVMLLDEAIPGPLGIGVEMPPDGASNDG